MRLRLAIAATLPIALAHAVYPASIGFQVNSNCAAGSCPAQPLAAGSTASLPFSATTTLSNGDTYSVVGTFNTSDSASGATFSLTYSIVITYLGNGNGGVSQADIVTIDAFSAFQSSLGTGNFSQALVGAFSPNVSSASSAQVCAAGVCLGPVTPPGTFSQTGGSYSLAASNGAFSFDNTFNTHFGAGSPVGSYVVYNFPAPGPPSVLVNGVVPVFGTATTVQPGSWISIYGNNLAVTTATWNGNFPTSLGATSVTIDSKPAYLWFVSSTQINAQVPDDPATGLVNVVVTTSAGSATSTVTLGAYGPSFSLLNSKYVAAIVATPGSPGNSGGGYDIIGPVGAFPYPSRPARAGETVQIYGVGFGPTTPSVLAGQAFSGVAPSVMNPTVLIGGVQATVAFAGIVEAGLFQLNVIVPNAPSGDQTLTASLAGATAQSNVYITLQ
jgi:uncharacterized protein (TIGR03437 family)